MLFQIFFLSLQPKLKYYERYDLATKYFELNLVSEKGKEAVEYLSKRGIDKDVIKEFHIGLALNDKDRLIKYFKAQKIDINTLNNYGLANNDVDTFINRVMFPLDDRFGKTVAFSGRIYEKSDIACVKGRRESFSESFSWCRYC